MQVFICPEVNSEFLESARAVLPAPRGVDTVNPYSGALIYDALLLASAFEVNAPSSAGTPAGLSPQEASIIQVCSEANFRTTHLCTFAILRTCGILHNSTMRKSWLLLHSVALCPYACMQCFELASPWTSHG